MSNQYFDPNAEWIKDSVIDDPNVAIMAIDDQCRFVFANDLYLRLYGFRREEIIGKRVDELVPYGRTPEILKTGQPIEAYVLPLNGESTIASSYPIIKNGKVIGVLGRSLFLDIEKAYKFCDMIKDLEDEMKSVREKEHHCQQKMYTFDKIIGETEAMQKCKALAMASASINSTVLITGESGTGKEMFAKAIHYSGRRKNHPFIRINCAAIPENLMESELFGYEEGSFTGALRGGKKGKFEMAEKGTIFLDEIGEIPPVMQAKLLVVLQEREIEPIGSQNNKPQKIDIRVIAATNRNLEAMVAEGSFRQDLYYRLNVINIEIPPLRQRKADLDLLINEIFKKLNKRFDFRVSNIDNRARKILHDYDWPGNVRELENVIERGMVRANMQGAHKIEPEHISELLSHNVSQVANNFPEPSTMDLKEYLKNQEKLLLEKVLRQTNGEKLLAAKILNIHISALYKKINKYGLDTSY
jgi:transcriptional regulator with PAS, ATPase and Fis domain